MNNLITIIKQTTFLFVLCFTSFVNAQTVQVEMRMDLGSIILEIYPDKAPITSQNFLKHIKNNQFEGAHFYRVVRMDNQPKNDIKIEVIQGGLGFSAESPYPPIEHETTSETGLLHTNGVLSMARLEPGTASSEFFICVGDQPELDFGGERNPDGQGFSAFGQVVSGMDVVRKIQNMTDDKQMLVETVGIQSMIILE